MYFDARQGHAAYLEEVKISESRFNLSCSKEVKMVLRRKTGAEEEGLKGPEAFSDVDYLLASGEVKIERLDAGGKSAPASATAAHAALNVRNGDIILRGGAPAIKQDTNSLVAGAENLYLRFYQNGSLYAEPGRWTTTGDLANLRVKPGEKRKPAKIITATCRGGLSFDSLKGQVVYREEIEVLESRFRMNCQGEMTIHLQERIPEKGERLEGPEAFSDVKAIVSRGGVTVLRKDPDGKTAPITASAETATYDGKTGDIVLRYGRPSIRQGNSFLKAKEDGLYCLFTANGNFFTNKGNWDVQWDPADLKRLHKQRE
jgi:lipopolysaccharide export system protein LptA